MIWIDYIGRFVILAFGIAWCIDIFRKRKQKPSPLPPPQIPRPSGVLLTPPPAPIDRTEFLQARIAYLAHMRNEIVEFTEKDESGEPIKRSRKMTRKEMIEAVNLQDEEHVIALLDTWDQVQSKQREKTL